MLYRRVLSAGVRVCEEGIFPVERNRADRMLDDIAVALDTAVVDEACEPLPT